MQTNNLILKRILCLLMVTTVVFGCADFKVEAAEPGYHTTGRATSKVITGISANDRGNTLVTESNNTAKFSLKTIRYYTTGNKTSTAVLKDKLATSFITPGLKVTNVLGHECENMVPQGICQRDGYFFITAYCHSTANGTGKCVAKHNSVIYVINASTGTYVTTLVLNQAIHVGGITYYKENLWTCDTKNGQGKLYYYNYEQVKSKINVAKNDNTIRSVAIGNCTNGYVNIPKGMKASFITTRDGYLCVGEYMDSEDKSEKGTATLNYFYTTTTPIDKSTLQPTNWKQEDLIDDAQGVYFYKPYANIEYKIVSTSKGRRYKSETHIYSSVNGGKFNEVKMIEMPSMMQGMAMYNGRTYFLYESGANAYRSECTEDCKEDGKCKCKDRTITGYVYAFTNNFIYK